MAVALTLAACASGTRPILSVQRTPGPTSNDPLPNASDEELITFSVDDSARGDDDRPVIRAFERRVATRVFRKFWKAVRNDLQQKREAIPDSTVVRGVMSQQGERIACTVVDPGGSGGLADHLLNACVTELYDPDPPAEARSPAGEIVMNFHAQLDAEQVPGETEERQDRGFNLLLEAGLE